jgi:transposase
MKITRIGMDVAKQVFQVHGVDAQERKVLVRQLRRAQVLEFFAKLAPCLIGMEACGSSHYWARKLGELGHTVRLIAPQFVKPYVKGNKNDANDAEAICEAVGRPHMRFVPVKSVAQQDLQALHRVRSELVRARTAKANQIRGLLGEYGIVLAQGMTQLRRALPQLLDEADEGQALSAPMRTLLGALRKDLVHLDERVAELDRAIERVAAEDAQARRLLRLRGVGPITATALVAALGDGSQFRRARDASAWAGLVPGQHSSGGKERLLGISKRGDAYVRTLLIHGARAVLKTAAKKDDRLSRWLQGLCARRNKNVAAVALANKTMRMAWALLTRGSDYDPEHRSTAAPAGAA